MASGSAAVEPIWAEEEIEMLPEGVEEMSVEDLRGEISKLENQLRILRSDDSTLEHQKRTMEKRLQENKQKVKVNTQLPFLVGNVVEILDADEEEARSVQDGSSMEVDSNPPAKSAVVKSTTRQTVFLPIIGLVPHEELTPGDLVGLNKDSFLIVEKIPAEYDSRVKAMEIDEKPTEDYLDVGGLSKQIEEMREAVVIPMLQKDMFIELGIKPPKGVLLYGEPGTGKTLLARACAAQTEACFLKLAGPQLVQMFIGDGAKIVRDAFALAREKAPAIIFIDELDAIGSKRGDGDHNGDREVQRTMLELLNQMDGFSSQDDIKVMAATNRVDILDPALLRSGRFDRKIEFPLPDEKAREEILRIHTRKMTIASDVNFGELSRSCEDFNGAQLKAVCVEGGMIALRREKTVVCHEDFMEGIQEVQAKKKKTLNYYV